MRRASLLGLLTLLTVTTLSRADFVIQTRRFTIHIGTRQSVPVTPPVVVPPPVAPPPGLPLEIAPPLTVPAVGVARPAVRALTLQEFARVFRPTCGRHQVTLIHPLTGCPVDVCFTLPHGCPEVEVHRRELEFNYRNCAVEIHFERDGRVRVEYDD